MAQTKETFEVVITFNTQADDAREVSALLRPVLEQLPEGTVVNISRKRKR